MELKNEIVVYQPDETVRLDVRLEGETVWLTQSQMAVLFGCGSDNVGLHLKNIYAIGELTRDSTSEEISVVRTEGTRRVRRKVTVYNLDAIISVGYRVNSVLGVKFRQWATGVLKEYLLRGYAINQRLCQLEDRVDRRLAKHEGEIAELKTRVDFFVQTQTPPLQGVFYEGQLWDACSLVEKLVARAKSSILLIDNWVGPGTLDLLAKKRRGVAVEVVTSARGNRLAGSDVAKFHAQYPTLAIQFRGK
ncbi:MAG: virulence RhuM family protein, partial [Kiritimatiellae bacterium]|nr:virulence RhuM family protein [Kiritimatiellia bacterium]